MVDSIINLWAEVCLGGWSLKNQHLAIGNWQLARQTQNLRTCAKLGCPWDVFCKSFGILVEGQGEGWRGARVIAGTAQPYANLDLLAEVDANLG